MSDAWDSDRPATRRSLTGAGGLVLGLGLVAVSLFMFFENLGGVHWRP